MTVYVDNARNRQHLIVVDDVMVDLPEMTPERRAKLLEWWGNRFPRHEHQPALFHHEDLLEGFVEDSD